MSIPRNGRSRPLFGKIKLTGIDYINKIKLSNLDKALLLSLVGLAKYKGLIYASQREIAEYIGKDVSTVNKSIKNLIQHGLVIKEKDHLRIDPTFCQFG